jgi:hypothetical protein
MTYEFILKNEKAKYYKAIRDLIAVFNLFGFIYLVNKTEDSFDKTFFIIFCAVTALYLLIVLYERFTKKIAGNNIHRSLFIWSAVGWSRSPFWWVSVLLLLFFILDILSQRKLILTVSENNIEYPSFPGRQIEWNELTNLVLKDGLITIDFKTNKIIQQTTLNPDIGEQEFNDFCRIQLNK